MENTTDNTFKYKRTSRHQSQETKQKIAQALRGKGKSDTHKERISVSLKDYWKDDSNFPDDV